MTIDFTPKDCPITLTKGDNPELEFKLKQPSGHPLAGEPIDLTGNTYKLTVNPVEDGSEADLFELTNSNIPDHTGVVKFAPTTANTDVPPDTYQYDLQETDAAAKVRTIAKGKFVVLPGISD